MIDFVFFLQLGLFLLSLYVLVKGADYFIEGAENIGKVFRISPFVVGVFILGFGTSLPELASAIASMLSGNTDLPAAVIIGSNITNILFVLGLIIVISKGITFKVKLVDKQLPIMAIVTLLFVLIGYDAVITTIEGISFLVAAGIYIVFCLSNENRTKEQNIDYKTEGDRFKNIGHSLLLIFGGGVSVFLGAHFLIKSTTYIALSLGVSAEIIGLTFIAFGTSLPEVVVAVKAVLKGRIETAVGTIIGSTIINITVILGISALFGNVIIDTQTFYLAMPFMVGVIFVLIISSITNRISLWEGLFFLLVYALFVLKIFGII